MNPSTAQARVIVDELVRCGVTDVVLAPGGRSAALALAVVAADTAGRLRLHVRIDERSAGFLALGIAQVSRRAVAVVTTSGTAAVNLAPAVTEASYGGIPLVLLTADRPPELRATGASQTIDQAAIFGTTVRWAHDIGVAEPRPGQVRYWRSVIDRAIDVAIEGGDPGPVHLNVPSRAPLTPEDDTDWVELLGLVPAGLDPDDLPDLLPHTVDGRLSLSAAQPIDEVLAPFVGDQAALADLFRALEDGDLEIDLADLDDDEEDDDADDEDEEEYDVALPGVVPTRGVVVVGHCADVDAGDAAIALAEACGWPLIGEPTGNARSGDTTLTHPAILLADNDFAADHQPEVAVVVGNVGLDRSVLALIQSTPLVIGVDARVALRRPDPTRTTTVHVAVVPEPPEEYPAYDDSWLDSWLAADAIARIAVERTLDATESLTGPDVARTVWDVLGPAHLLQVASSWPVRHLSSFARVRDTADTPLVVGNRGVAGIDGLVSTAWGAALGHQGEHTTLVEDVDGGAHRRDLPRRDGVRAARRPRVPARPQRARRRARRTPAGPGVRRRRQRRRRHLQRAGAGGSAGLRAGVRHPARPGPGGRGDRGRGPGRRGHGRVDAGARPGRGDRRRWRPCRRGQGRRPGVRGRAAAGGADGRVRGPARRRRTRR